jgi:hypothetical protein
MNRAAPEVEKNSTSEQQTRADQGVVCARQRHQNVASITGEGHSSEIRGLRNACSVCELGFNITDPRQLNEVTMTAGEAQMAREARIQDRVDAVPAGAMYSHRDNRLSLLADASLSHRYQRSSIAAR